MGPEIGSGIVFRGQTGRHNRGPEGECIKAGTTRFHVRNDLHTGPRSILHDNDAFNPLSRVGSERIQNGQGSRGRALLTPHPQTGGAFACAGVGGTAWGLPR